MVRRPWLEREYCSDFTKLHSLKSVEFLLGFMVNVCPPERTSRCGMPVLVFSQFCQYSTGERALSKIQFLPKFHLLSDLYPLFQVRRHVVFVEMEYDFLAQISGRNINLAAKLISLFGQNFSRFLACVPSSFVLYSSFVLCPYIFNE